jgi:class 3 adenylate cyclase/tetratricopeptide (TPR) repeat protein
MTFEELLDQVLVMLQRRGRVSYRTLARQFVLDEADLEDLKEAILFAHPQVVDEASRGLIWTGAASAVPLPAPDSLQPVEQPVTLAPRAGQTAVPPPEPYTPDAERRQLTVLFCDLVDSTVLARQLDPEELREVVRAYQDTCAKVIARFEGHIAQYLGDGLLVYFGYPLAHEDDAQRAVRAGLGMIEALGQLNTSLGQEREVQLAVRLGVHTGLVVVGEVGSGTRQEQLARGETPNLAARLQGLAATLQLLRGFFACQSLGTQLLKGFEQPLEVYQVLSESTARSRLDAVGSPGLTPLVGREQEVGLLLERWAQVKDGLGQVVLLSGEAGIGKSRLVQVLKEHVASEPQVWLTPCQCSPYYQNTALYPLIDLLERVTLRFEREEPSAQKLRKLEGFLAQYGLSLAEAVPLFAALLSLPLTADYAPLTVSPEQQKQKTLQALLTILLRIAAQQPLLFVMEDLHWVDPTTLELLSLLVDQGPTACMLVLLTFRPDFSPPWTGRAHLRQVTLKRLPRRQAVEMTARVAHGRALPAEVVEQVVAKTDGVPLFVEELTKMVLETGLLQEREERYELTRPLPPLAIPTTLHDSLMARLDRLATVKSLAQFGATLGREFSYELLQAVAPWDEETFRHGLQQLVAAEFLYQQGFPPQATYVFKHALIQEAAYQALLRSTRQQYHQRIAQALEGRFPHICGTQPELLAQHYSEAGLMTQAIPYWQRAGQRAIERSAHVEAIGHLTRGLELCKMLPETVERAQQELDLQMTPGSALAATKGQAAPETGHAYNRARELCQRVGEPPQLFPVLGGLVPVYINRGELQTALELGKQMLSLAPRVHDPAALGNAHIMLGNALSFVGEMVTARTHLEQGITLYKSQQHGSSSSPRDTYPVVLGLSRLAQALWHLGYPDQALQRSQEALTLARALSPPRSLATALIFAAVLYWCRREGQMTCEHAKAALVLSGEQGFAFRSAEATILWGWALAEQGQAGLAQIRQGLNDLRTTGTELNVSHLIMLAEASGSVGQTQEGLQGIAEALAVSNSSGGSRWVVELYRLKGELLLTRSSELHAEAETCFCQAFDIADLQEAKALLEALA